MKKSFVLTFIASLALILVAFNQSSLKLNIQDNSDPNVIHVPVNNGGGDISTTIKKLFNPRPDWNPFNDNDQMIVNRNTNTFYIFSINEDVSTVFEHESSLMAADGAKLITIDLHSPGGEVFAAYIIKQQIRILKNQGVTVRTIVESKNACMSACPIIFLSGDQRIAYSDSVFMFHSPYIQFPYNASEDVIAELMRELRTDKLFFLHDLETYCPADTDLKMDIFDHDEHFYRADDLASKCGTGSFFTSLIPVPEQKSLIKFGI